MNDLKAKPSNWAASSRTNTIRLRNWTGAWLVTMAVATFGPLMVWPANKLLTILAITTNLLIGFGMIVANKQHLKGLDEMHQKIQLEAMALSLGIGLVVGLSYSLLDTTNIISSDAEISHLVILMGLTYLAAVFAGLKRYR
jgi:uncharacterized protein YacL